MLAINRGGHFLFIEVGKSASLGKLIYGGGRLKTTASKNGLFSEAVALKSLPP
jgi:hypothetical protein